MPPWSRRSRSGTWFGARVAPENAPPIRFARSLDRDSATQTTTFTVVSTTRPRRVVVSAERRSCGGPLGRAGLCLSSLWAPLSRETPSRAIDTTTLGETTALYTSSSFTVLYSKQNPQVAVYFRVNAAPLECVAKREIMSHGTEPRRGLRGPEHLPELLLLLLLLHFGTVENLEKTRGASSHTAVQVGLGTLDVVV